MVQMQRLRAGRLVTRARSESLSTYVGAFHGIRLFKGFYCIGACRRSVMEPAYINAMASCTISVVQF